MRPFLKADQWLEAYAYDAGHILMVPLHAAFEPDSPPEWAREYAEHFERFCTHAEPNGLPENRLARCQYLYVGSQFTLLCVRHGLEELIPARLIALLQSVHTQLWRMETAGHFLDPFPGGIRERLRWKIDTTDSDPTYLQNLADDTMYLLTISADLKVLGESTDDTTEAVEMAHELFEKRGQFQPDGGWLLNPGVMWDHSDYAYAGHDTASDNMSPLPIPGIAGDTSHAHRLGRWVRSLLNASRGEPAEQLYESIIDGLTTQFLTHALVPPDDEFLGYRTTNYMDGRNGLYRWEYRTQGENNGYLPYELSGTLMLGWWTFLDDVDVRGIYSYMADAFPLPENVLDVYVGPGTIRERHPLAAIPAFFTNGLSELICRMAATLAISE